MTQLYITFFAIGLLVFAAIVLFSWLQQSRQKNRRGDVNDFQTSEYDDPIFTDVQSKSKDKKIASTFDETNEITKTATGTKTIEKDRLDLNGPSFADQQHKEKAATNDKVSSKKRMLDIVANKKVKSNQTPLPVVEMKDETGSSKGSSTGKGEQVSEIADNVEIINVQPKRDKSSSSIVMELVARVNNSESIEQKELLTLFRNHDFKFHRQIHIYGLNQLTDLWRDIEYELPSARFVELGVAIQLADRDGAMTKKELHDFQQMALEFSNHFDAPFEFSMDIDEALVQARVLDQMGRRYDSMAVLNVVPRSKSGFRIADLESCARDLGMTRSKNGIFLKTTGQKNQISILYRLACTDSTGDFGLSSGSSEQIHDLVIYMNVPATKTPEIVFQDMVKDVNSLATWLEGKVVDKDGKVMTQRSYSVLTQQISDISFSMQQDGLIPGDSVCKKLF